MRPGRDGTETPVRPAPESVPVAALRRPCRCGLRQWREGVLPAAEHCSLPPDGCDAYKWPHNIKLGARHVGKLVTVVIEDTHYRVLHDDEEIAVRPRRDTGPITRLHSRGMNTQPD